MGVEQVSDKYITHVLTEAVQNNIKYEGVIYRDNDWVLHMEADRNDAKFKVATRRGKGKNYIDCMPFWEDEYGDYGTYPLYGTLDTPEHIRELIEHAGSVYDNLKGSKHTFNDYYLQLERIEEVCPSCNGEIDYKEGANNAIQRLLGDEYGRVFYYLGKFSVFTFFETRDGRNIKTGLPGEDEDYLVNVRLINKHVYIPLMTMDDLKFFRHSARMGIVKIIEHNVKIGNYVWLKSLGRDEQIEEYGWTDAHGLTDNMDLDFNNYTYTGKGDRNMLKWAWRFHPDSCDDEGYSNEETEKFNIHW